MKLNRKTFFAEIKSVFPGGYEGRKGKGRIAGLDVILDEFEARGDVEVDELAYILATTIWETAYTVQPIKEGGGEAYLKSKKYWPWYGRGYVQLTWEKNYKFVGDKIGVDLISDPELALNPKVAVKILFDGMLEGWFTGKKLSDYLDGHQEADTDDAKEFENARRIINGVDRKKEIAKIALKVDRAIRKAEVANPYPLHSSRTVQGAVVAGGMGAKELVESVNAVVQATEAHQEAFTSGQVVGIAIGLIAVCGALYALYARWDDAGRPKFWQ